MAGSTKELWNLTAQRGRRLFQSRFKILITGKSFSEVLIFASTNPQNDNILFIE